MTAPLPRGIGTFDVFWMHYLGQHQQRGCRVMHYFAAVTAGTLVVLAVRAGCPWTLSAAPIAAYLLAWIGHAFVERNRPATWSYPWWSLRAEARMVRLAMTGRLEAELERSRHETTDGPF